MMDLKRCCKYILDLIFPNKCPCCGRFIKYDELLCDKCIEKLPEINEQPCEKCGKVECICNRKLYYDRCFVGNYYEGVVKKGIINLKYHKGINFAEFFCNIISDQIIRKGYSNKIDVITFVPMSKQSTYERCYNQAEEIAELISEKINKPVNRKILIKKYNNVSQHTLSNFDRRQAVKGLYSINNKVDISGKRVLICDDVITTGSTLNECARLLKEQGASKVYCLALATTRYKKK